jgi:transposase InsO family protein/transposase-like protein
MYSYSDQIKAVELYIQYGKSAAATVRALGYPSEKQLRRWYQSYVVSKKIPPRKKRKPKYSAVERRRAVEHYFSTGQCIARTIRALGYPSREWLRAWIDGESPVKKPSQARSAGTPERSGAERKLAVIELCTRQTSAAEVAKKFDVTRQALYKWRNQLLDNGAGKAMKRRRNQATENDCEWLKAEVKALERRVHELQLEHDILMKANDLLKKEEGVNPRALSNREKALLVDALKDTYQLAELFAALDLPRSSYYYNREALQRPDKYSEARQEIVMIFESNYRCYGYRRISESLRRAGTRLSEKVVRRLMAEEGLVVHSTRRNRFNTYRGELSPAPENIIARDFRSSVPNEKWLTDLTEFAVPPGKVYLSPMIDCFDGLVVSWSISSIPNANLVNAMLDEAISTLAPGETPTIHTDRGCHYRWPGWIQRLEAANLTRSMSRKGCTPDNAACEAFFGRLKTEFFYPRQWAGVSIEEFVAKLDEYIRWYNETRIKMSLGGISPIEYRQSLGIAA